MEFLVEYTRHAHRPVSRKQMRVYAVRALVELVQECCDYSNTTRALRIETRALMHVVSAELWHTNISLYRVYEIERAIAPYVRHFLMGNV